MTEKAGAGAKPQVGVLGDAAEKNAVVIKNLVGVVQALTEAGIDPATIIRPKQAGERPKRAHSNLPVGAQWIGHEKAGSRAAQRRLRQAAKGHHRLEARCSVCGEWTSSTLGGFTDEKSGKFACNGCAAAYVEGLR